MAEDATAPVEPGAPAPAIDAQVPATAPSPTHATPSLRPSRAGQIAGAALDLAELFAGAALRASVAPLTVVVAVGFIAAYLVLAVLHLSYPYELEWMEGGLVDAVRHIASGGRLYQAPTLEYVPYIYAPFYFYVSLAASKVFGVGFFALRLVSFASSVGATTLLALIAWRETRSALSALLAAGLFLATYKLGSAFLDIARVDSLFLLLMLGAIYLVRFHPSRRGQIVAAALLALAVFTKQSGLFVAAALVAWAILSERKKALPFGLGTIAFIAIGLVALNLYYQGWFNYYLFWIPRQHPSRPEQIYRFWYEDVLTPLSLVCASALVYFALGDGRARRLYGAATLGAGVTAWTGRIHAGGWSNVDIPLFAMLALVATLGADIAVRRVGAGRGRALVLTAALFQFVVLVYDPRKLIPSADDRAAGDALIATLRDLPGDVFFPAHGNYLALAGKKTMAQEMAINDIVGIGGGKPGRALKRDITSALKDRRFGAAVLDTDFLKKEVEQTYRRDRDVVHGRDAFFTLTGMRTRPKSLYVPR